jgi:Zn-dependent protease with chaperone function
MTAAVHLLITLVLCTVAVHPLAHARWVWRAPRTGILLWQMLALTWVLSVIMAVVAIGLAPYGTDIPAAFAQLLAGAQRPAGFTVLHLTGVVAGFGLATALIVAFVLSWSGVLRTRRRHRDMLALVGREDPAAPGALVLDHPLAVAYCLPGLRAQVVVSSGAVEALTADQLAAVLAHEHTHARERHDLILLPFAALRRLTPRLRLVDVAVRAVALLVEMCADDRACRDRCPASLASALRRFSASSFSPPAGTLGITDAAVEARLQRINGRAAPLPVTVRWLVLATGLVLVSTPLSFFVV